MRFSKLLNLYKHVAYHYNELCVEMNQTVGSRD